MNAPSSDPGTIHDVLGIGFGPSNLALAIAIEEHNATVLPEEQVNALFLERQPRFGWHRGMLIDDATMQVSFLKDLVTMRNPTSDFSFLCYLREQGRLVDFLNQKTLFPLRVEFHDYFEWAAARVGHLAAYSQEVLSITPVSSEDGTGGAIDCFDVVCRDPQDPDRTVTRRARNISVAVGLQPHLPPDTELSDRVVHNSQLLPRVAELAYPGPPCAGPSSSARARARRRRWTTSTAPSPTPRCAPSSPNTATPRRTTAPSPTGSSIRRRWTSTSTPRPR